MLRREFVVSAGCTLAAWPLAIRAQRAGGIPVVGVLALGVEGRAERLREGLRRLGYLEGRNIRLEERSAGDHYARLADIADEFVRLKVDVIVAMGNTATVAASKATSTIPIVMMSAVDPVNEKLAASLSHPGGNVTGLTTLGHETVAKRLQMAKEVVPGLTRLGVLWNRDSRGSTNALSQAKDAATALKLELHVVEARSAGELEKAFEAFAKARLNVFVLMSSGMFSVNRKQILESATKRGLAGVFSSGDWVDSGALFSYGTDIFEAERQVALYVDKILKGAKPGDLAIEQPTKFEFVVNLKAAKVLGIKIPQSILLRADRVIE